MTLIGARLGVWCIAWIRVGTRWILESLDEGINTSLGHGVFLLLRPKDSSCVDSKRSRDRLRVS